MRRRAFLYGGLGLLAACTINPVTGDRELALVSPADEIAIGRAQYLPSRQMQGGDYVRDPALTNYVRTVGQRLAAVSDRELPYEFVVLNNSVPNAWALPGGKIAINRGLLTELETEAELAAVLGHEIVHAAARHSALAMQRGLLLQGAVLVAAAASRNNDYSGLAVGAAGLGAQLINMRNGRAAELESDRFGMQYMSRAGYDPAGAVSLQETFLRLSENRANQGWLAGLFASHPPSSERVAANRATAATLPAGGDVGRDRYQAAVRNLESAAPAYSAYDAGQAALAAGSLGDAERLANEAVSAVGNEGHFHALLGDIDLARDDGVAAERHFADAIAVNDSFFYYHLRRGEALRRERRLADARVEFERSLELLPTADAYLGLGRIAEASGDRIVALDNYRRAAESSGAAGDSAREATVRLDLPTNPGQYLAVSTAFDAAGRLAIDVGNPHAFAIADLAVRVVYRDTAGVTRQIGRLLPGPILPANTARLTVELPDRDLNAPAQVALESARIAE